MGLFGSKSDKVNKGIELYKQKQFGEAISCFTKALKDNKNCYDACFYLGICYCNGEGVSQNYEIGVELLEKAAKGNMPAAQFQLAEMYDNGLGVEQDFEKAAYWLGESFKNEYLPALYKAGTMYFTGNGLDKDIDKAATCFLPCARDGHLESQRLLSEIYLTKTDTDKKYFKDAIFWCEKAANQNDPTCQFNMANYYYSGDMGLKTDLSKAAYWYEQAANNGVKEAYIFLGSIYHYGDDSIRDYEKSFYWLSKAAEVVYDNVYDNVYVQNLLGICFTSGIGTKANIKEAIHWFTKAGEQGDAVSQVNLGIMYMDIIKDIDQAVFWLTKAAENGVPKAQFRLSICYQEGLGVVKNSLTALKWLSLAQKNGDDEALKLQRIDVID